jgi:hypothetical protein
MRKIKPILPPIATSTIIVFLAIVMAWVTVVEEGVVEGDGEADAPTNVVRGPWGATEVVLFSSSLDVGLEGGVVVVVVDVEEEVMEVVLRETDAVGTRELLEEVSVVEEEVKVSVVLEGFRMLESVSKKLPLLVEEAEELVAAGVVVDSARGVEVVEGPAWGKTGILIGVSAGARL